MRLKSTLGVLVAGLIVLTAAGSPVRAATPQEPRLRPPVYGSGVNGAQLRNFADPSILRHGNRYYAYSTNQTGRYARHLMVMSSANLWDWDAPALAPQDAMPTRPAWARALNNGGAYWAPSVIRTGGRFVMYFAAKHRNIDPNRAGWCIGVATSANPKGPFRPRARPFFCRVASSGNTPAGFSGTPAVNKGAIDPQVFRAPNGRLYLYFKALDNLRQLWGVQLTANGLGRVGPGRGFAPMDSQARTWEYSNRLRFTVLENPAMVHHPGVSRPFLLLYAGGEWQTPGNYGTGYLACRTPLSGCVRLTRSRPWLRSRGANAGPGGASTFTGPDGKPWIAYHTYQKGHVMDGRGRRLHVEPLRFAGVHPRLQNRRPTGTVTATSPGAGEVRLSGTADDPDTGRPVRIRIRKNSATGPVAGTTRTSATGSWAYPRINGLATGTHRYCALAIDDNGLSDRVLGCRNVTVA